jgi:hypothetical protein
MVVCCERNVCLRERSCILELFVVLGEVNRAFDVNSDSNRVTVFPSEVYLIQARTIVFNGTSVPANEIMLKPKRFLTGALGPL